MNLAPINSGDIPSRRSSPLALTSQETSPLPQDAVDISDPSSQPKRTDAVPAPAGEKTVFLSAPKAATAAPTPAFQGWQVAGARVSPDPVVSGFNRANMDLSVDPGQDFFHYAMGSYLNNHPIPESESSSGIDAEVGATVKQNLRGILDEAASNPQNADEKRLGDFYASGMDMAARDRAGLRPVQGLLDDISRISDLKGLQSQVARLQKSGINPLFDFGSGQDLKDQSQVIGQVSQGGLGLPDRDYYTNTDASSLALKEKYLQHVARTFELTGQDPASAARSAATVVAVETGLAQTSMTRVELRDPVATYNPMDAKQLATLSPNFDWHQYLGDLGRPDLSSLNVATPKFFTGLDKLLSETPLEDWKTYLSWTTLRSTAASLSSPLADEDFAFRKELTGAKEQAPLWKTMVQTSDDFLGDSVGQLFVKKFFSPEAKTKAEDMVNNVIGALGKRIEKLDWMGEATKGQALDKLTKMNFKVGYPENWKDYGDLEFDRANFGGNILKARQFQFNEDLQRIGAPVDKNRWLMTPSTVNAYYDPSNNEFVMPAAVLQPPYFDLKADDAMNYGSTAATIGHEITHGFDDQGALFDATGNLRDWWTEQDKANFDKRTQGVEKQFSEFRYEGIPVDGKLVLGESVADLGGLEIAYHAYQMSREKAPAHEARPSPDGFSDTQRFFLSYAQSWGTNIRPEKAKMQLATDPHPLPQFRVMGPLANLPDFLGAFSIAPGSAMYRPVELRNSLWG